MPVSTSMSTKTLLNTQRGELVLFPRPNGNNAWAIVLEHDVGEAVLAVLAPGDTAWTPCHYTDHDGATACVGFGIEWVFEPLPFKASVSSELKNTTGSWVVQSDDVGLRLSTNGAFGEGAGTTLNMRTLERLQVNRGHAVAGQHWQLWASQAEMDNPRCEPLLVHPFADQV